MTEKAHASTPEKKVRNDRMSLSSLEFYLYFKKFRNSHAWVSRMTRAFLCDISALTPKILKTGIILKKSCTILII